MFFMNLINTYVNLPTPQFPILKLIEVIEGKFGQLRDILSLNMLHILIDDAIVESPGGSLGILINAF